MKRFPFMHFFNFSIANNHPLNTVLILAFTFFTRLYFNELVIRLPNLLFYALYLIVAVKFSACFKNRILAFSLLAFNYYLSEYFGLARGYGIAAALVLTGLYLYYNRRGDPQSILYALIAFVAACSANYSLLAFLGCFVLYTFYFDIRLANLPAFIKRYWPHFALMLIAVAGMAYCFIQGHTRRPPPGRFARYFFQRRHPQLRSDVLARRLLGAFHRVWHPPVLPYGGCNFKERPAGKTLHHSLLA